MDWSCSFCALHTVLVFTALLAQVSPRCSINSSTADLVYLKHTVDSSMKLLVEAPSLDGINSSCQEQKDCCVSSDGQEYLFSSLDDALSMVENSGKNESLSFLVALLGNGTSVYHMRESHAIANFTTFMLQSVSNSSSVLCNENVSLSVSEICTVVVQAVSVMQCGSMNKGSLTIENARSINMTDILIQASFSSGIKANLLSLPPFCGSDGDDGDNFFMISNSTFINNGQQTKTADNGGEFYGGGVAIRASIDALVSIINSKFIENNASIGAGLAYSAFNSDESFLHVNNCEFIRNHANVHGGVAHLFGTKTHFENTNFINNSAGYTSGAIYQFIPLQVETDVQIRYNGCRFDGNRAQGSACLTVASSIASFYEVDNHNQTLDISNCVFLNNVAQKKLFFGQTSCIIHSDDVFLNFKDTNFSSNSATVVCVQSSLIILSGTIEFKNNNGYLGGAVNTIRSLIKVLPNTSVLFSGNQAAFGGAIYEDGIRDNSNICLFDFPVGRDYNVTFSNNNALSQGHSIYFYAVNDQCLYEIERSEVVLDLDEATSGATSVTFHNPINFNSTNQEYLVDLILGQLIVFNVTMLDFFHWPSFAQVNVILVNNEIQPFTYNSGPYRLEGFQHISVEDGLNRPNLFITGPKVNDTQNHLMLSINGSDISGAINVFLKPCPLGFVYNETTQRCLCVKDDVVACDFTLAVSCIKKGYWIGNMDDTPSVAPCASLFCQNNYENCSLCPITDKVGYCLLPQFSVEQCLPHRQGFLCSRCEDGYALTFGAIKCVKDSSCRSGMSAIPVFLDAVFVAATIVLLICALKLDYRLSSGYLFCFIYYFSIIRHLLNPVIVGDAMLIIISILTSVTQLNPQFLGYISICFFTNLTALQQQAFVYLNPVVISIFVLLVIALSRYFSKHIKFGDNTMVKAISLLLLLSFTALLETSFNILNPVQFSEVSGIRVNIEPSVKYFDPKHLPWFLIAILTVLLLVVPFTFVLLFAPLLSKCFNLIKIKPFLDEFQSCYKDKFRWMAGYYFVARFIYLVILTAPRYVPIVTQYVIQLLSFTVLLIHMLLQPYKNNWMNLADSILLADIVVITALFGSTAGVVFEDIPTLRLAFVYILVLIPVVYLIIVIIVTSPWIKFDLKRFKKGDDDTTNIVTHTSVDRESRSLSTSIGLREPLLEMMDDGNITSLSNSPVSDVRGERRRKLVSHSIVGSPREEDEVQGHLTADERGKEKGGVFWDGKCNRSPSVSSQSWLSETSTSNDEEKLINKLL